MDSKKPRITEPGAASGDIGGVTEPGMAESSLGGGTGGVAESSIGGGTGGIAESSIGGGTGGIAESSLGGGAGGIGESSLGGGTGGIAESFLGGEIGGAKTVAEPHIKMHSTKIDSDIMAQFGIPSTVTRRSNDFLTFSALYPNPSGILNLVLEYGADVNHKNNVGGGTALHLAACIGSVEVAQILIQLGATVDAIDNEGDTPLAKALKYKKDNVVKLLLTHGAKRQGVFILADVGDMFPELEIDPSELRYNFVEQMSGRGEWLKLPVTIHLFDEETKVKTYRLRAFRDEVFVLRQIRHPNIAMFFGIVVQSPRYPMMIVMEYLPKGDLQDYLMRKGSLGVLLAVRFALDIARGMNYLHEHKPKAIVLRNLEPVNILMDDAGNLKIANFSSSKLLKESDSLKEGGPYSTLGINHRYKAPELFRKEEYNTKVDVFSFSLVLYEMIEGHPPFPDKEDLEVQQAYAQNSRPDFNDMSNYQHGLFALITQCWSSDPANRPTFRDIIRSLTNVEQKLVDNNSGNKKQGRTTTETFA